MSRPNYRMGMMLTVLLPLSGTARASVLVPLGAEESFPLPRSLYQSVNSPTFSTTVPIELVSLSLEAVPGGFSSPLTAVVAAAQSIISPYDVTATFDVAGDLYVIESTLNIDVRLQNNGGGNYSIYDILGFSLTGNIPVVGVGPISLTTIDGSGWHTLVGPSGPSTFEVDGSFSLFTQISTDNGAYVPANDYVTVDLVYAVPETSSLALMAGALSVATLAALRPRKQKP